MTEVRAKGDEVLSALSLPVSGPTSHPAGSGSPDPVTVSPSDQSDHASVLRRILPQFASALVSGLIEPLFGTEEVGRSFALGHWQQWPSEQATAVEEFLQAWWAHTLTDPDPAVPVHDLLVLSAEATGTLSPWLNTWKR